MTTSYEIERRHESTVKGNPCRGENNEFESFYSWLDEFIFRSTVLPSLCPVRPNNI